MKPDGTYAEAVAAEIRAIIARQHTTATATAAHAGMSLQAFARRYRGEVPFGVDDLDVVCRVLGTTAGRVLGVVDEARP